MRRPAVLPFLILTLVGCDQTPPAPERSQTSTDVSKSVASTPQVAAETGPSPLPANRAKGGDPSRLPLARILALAEADTPGEVVDVELEQDDDREVYEITVLRADGRTIELTFDAASGAVLDRDDD